MQDYPVLLATNFLEENQLTINVTMRCISRQLLSGANWEYYANRDDLGCNSILRKVPCLSTTSVRAPVGSTMQMHVVWTYTLAPVPETCGGCEDGDTNLFFLDDLCVEGYRQLHGGLIDGRSQSATVSITNHGSKTEIIKADEPIGTISTVIQFEDGPSNSGEVNVVTVEETEEAADQEEFKMEDLVIGDTLSAEERMRVVTMLTVEKEFLSCVDYDIGCIKGPSHKIELTDDTPIYQRPRRFPQTVTQEIESQRRELLLAGIIESSSSTWSSPVVPIRKMNGSMRLCMTIGNYIR